MLYIGTSGFSYDDWVGTFYPEKTPKKNMLAYYARVFPAVEINSTYYAIPPASSFAAMARNTPENFKFVVKAHKEMTHADQPEQGAFDAFFSAVEPLKEAGKLGCILVQYPWGFKRTHENEARLLELKDRVGGLPTVIELRNQEWAADETYDFLGNLGLGFCCVDEPELNGLMPRTATRTSGIGYVRFHGRNSEKWWQHDQAYERYNYLYPEEELQEWVPKVAAIDNGASDTYLFFNNHYKGKAADNARAFARMLGLTINELRNPRQLTLDDLVL
ncbi:MAG: DUF72 domain-containing protein [Armatimonadota bacterium]|nr:DUF72 domain-containing protein [bacterium]